MDNDSTAYSSDAGTSSSDPSAPTDTKSFNQVSVSTWLAVGASNPPDASAVYVSGDQRIDGTLTIQTLAFEVNTVPTTAEVIANGETPGQLGLTGVLRVQDALGVGTAPTDDLTSVGQVVVRGGQGASVPLQLWQAGDQASLGVLDANGRLGVGTDALTARLTVQSTFGQPLQGTVSGKANLHTLKGTGTAFTSELRTGDWISIPDADPTVFQVTVQSDTTLKLDPAPTANFSGATAYRGDDLIASLQDAHGGQQLTLSRWGDLSVTGDAAVGGGLTATGATQLKDTLDVTGAATLSSLAVAGNTALNGLSVTGVASVQGLSVAGNTALNGLNVTGTSQLSSLTVSGSTTLGGLTVSGPATLGGLTVAGVTSLASAAVTGPAWVNSLAVGTAGNGASLSDGQVWLPGPIGIGATPATTDWSRPNASILAPRSVIQLGRPYPVKGQNGEIVGTLGFLDTGVAHGQLSYRAGSLAPGFNYGFELIDCSTTGPVLDYPLNHYPYANLFCGLAFTDQVQLRSGHLTSTSSDGALVLNAGPRAISGLSGIWFRSTTTLGDTDDYVDLMRLRQTSDPGTGVPGDLASLDVYGTLNYQGSLGTLSDARLKTAVAPIEGALERLAGLRGVTFAWRGAEADPPTPPATTPSPGAPSAPSATPPGLREPGRRELGLIGQEVERVFPEAVSTWGDTDYKALDYTRLTPVLVEAVKELAQRNDVLTRRVSELEQALADRPGARPGERSAPTRRRPGRRRQSDG